ncbi:family 20 glycosylhydrolase [Candidatus Saccharibacteria bacterium]|nr:family 20 glycosylhydrolase [Candidatus Saccharibacteria bacterium]
MRGKTTDFGRNKKPLLFAVLLFVVAGIGLTIAYNSAVHPFSNDFGVAGYKTLVSEDFVSPTNWTPCDEAPKTVFAKNESSVDVSVRLKYNEYWLAADDITRLPLERDGARLVSIVFQNEDDWELRDDGYYYYKVALSPGASTSSLFEKIVFNCEANMSGRQTCTETATGTVCERPADEYEDAHYHLAIRVETAQSDVASDHWANIAKESMIMLDVARRYYPVNEIKRYIDVLSVNKNSTLQMHFTDDENVGIECDYLDQTVANATYENGVYTNNANGKKFLSYAQVRELMDYADAKGVEFVPEIDMPAHMTGFLDLAVAKFGYEAVRSHEYGYAWGTGEEADSVDIVREQGKNFIKALYDEYTAFFSDRKYFHMGFDEYTFRIDEKIDFANEMYNYLAQKGFKVRMWSDAVTKTNIDNLNTNIEIIYWGWWADVEQYGYATVPDFQERGFKLIITNRFYLFFVPSVETMTAENNARTIRDIRETWELDRWNYTFPSKLNTRNGILGGAVCIWGENSAGVSDEAIFQQASAMYNAMYPKLDTPSGDTN